MSDDSEKVVFLWEDSTIAGALHVLVIKDQPPIVLQPGVKIVIGRHRRCDLVIKSPKSSRRHAAIQWHGPVPELVDLSSNNGTFLNGQKIDVCPINDGDEINIADFLAHYRRVNSLDELDSGGVEETETRFSVGSMQQMSGTLRQQNVYDVLSELKRLGATGRLKLSRWGAEVVVVRGEPIAVHCHDLQGEAALLQLLTLDRGRYDFVPEDVYDQSRNVNVDIRELLTKLASFQLQHMEDVGPGIRPRRRTSSLIRPSGLDDEI